MKQVSVSISAPSQLLSACGVPKAHSLKEMIASGGVCSTSGLKLRGKVICNTRQYTGSTDSGKTRTQDPAQSWTQMAVTKHESLKGNPGMEDHCKN